MDHSLEVMQAMEDRRDLSKARSLSYWSLVGFFVPVVGLILAGTSISTIRGLPQELREAEKARTILHNATTLLVLNLLVLVGWVIALTSLQA